MQNLYENRSEAYLCCSTNKLSDTVHLHHELEVVWAAHDGIKVTCDGESYTLNENDLFIAFPNCTHSYEDKWSEKRNLLMIFKPEQFPMFAELMKSKKPICPVVRNCSGRIGHAVEGLLCTVNSVPYPYREPIMIGYLTVIISEFAQTTQMTERNQRDISGLHRLLEYCSNNYHKDLTLDILARELYMSRYYISHLFNDSLGISMHEYLNSLRVNEAKRLLRNESVPVTEIAEIVGFGTQRTFNRVFLAKTGHTPSEDRKNYIQSVKNS